MGGRYLMVRRAAGIPAGGTWCSPGGGIEPGESAEEAVVRGTRTHLDVLLNHIAFFDHLRRPFGSLTS